MQSTLFVLAVVFAQQGTKPAAVTESERVLLKNAQYSELYTIAVSRIASEKVTDPRVKQLAANIVKDHQATLQTIDKLATERGMSTKMMSPKQKDALSRFNLTATDRLAGEYLTQITQRLQNAIGKLTQLTRSSKDPALVGYASSRIPILNAQLKRAQTLKNQLQPAQG